METLVSVLIGILLIWSTAILTLASMSAMDADNHSAISQRAIAIAILAIALILWR